MPRAEEFDAFYTHTRARLLHLTYAVTGDLGAAAAAVRDAYAHAWQRWRRLRTREAETWVRHEARRLAALRHSAHLRRRLDDTGADIELLEALHAIPAQHRLVLLLQLLAELDLPAAAHEVGLSESAARAATDSARTELSHRLAAADGSVVDLESRVDGLRTVSERVVMPRPATIRQRGRRRQRRRSLVAVVAVAAAVAVSGFAVTLPADVVPEAMDRRQLGEPPPTEPERPEPPGADEDQLLRATQLHRLDQRAAWTVTAGSSEIYSICQPRRSADPRPREILLRTFRADTDARQRLVQSVEVSRDTGAAVEAYWSTLSWYASCQVPRVQLASHQVVDRRGGDVQILTFKEALDPVRTLTVAVARSGVVTTSLVHEVDRPVGPSPKTLANSMAAALDRLCTTSNGRCGEPGRPSEAPLPPTGEGAGFLGVVDLPPVADLDTVWAGTDPDPTPVENPAVTLCGQADFTEPTFGNARSRSFVMPESDLQSLFGLSETVAGAGSAELAEQFVSEAVARIQSCPERELTATIDSYQQVGDDDVDGYAWQLSFEIDAGDAVTYRLGLARHENRVAALTFSGPPAADIGAEAFADLVLRAGQRLRELDQPARR